jgi:general secretion pathway protein K
LTLLAVLATAVTVDARTDMALARNAEAAARAELLADAAVLSTIAALRRAPEGPEEDESPLATFLARRPQLEDTIVRRMGPEVMMDALPLVAGGVPQDGRPSAMTVGDSTVTVSVQAAGGLIDPNTAQEALLEGLFMQAGLAPKDAQGLAAAIRDYADEDGLVRAGGAEVLDYRAAGLPPPKNARFQVPEDLQNVLGMTRGLYAKVRPAITVWSGRPGIDPRLAPPQVLWALPGGNHVQIERLLTDRAAGIARTPRLTGVDDVTSLSRGRTFAICAEARDGAARFVREAVIRLDGRGRGFRIFRWQRAGHRQSDLPSPPCAL